MVSAVDRRVCVFGVIARVWVGMVVWARASRFCGCGCRVADERKCFT